MTKLICTLVASAAALSALASPAVAGEHMKFKYQSYELETAGGRQALMGRLDDKARSACRADDRLGLSRHNAAMACLDEAVRTVVAQIGDARLTAMIENASAVASN